MRLGILTFFNGFNFGANLQAVSTYLYLKKHGHTPIFINYKSKENYNRWLNLHQNNQFQAHLQFVNRIIKNQTTFCHDSGEIMSVINSEQIDAVIIGSDAVLQHHPFLTRLKFDKIRLVRKSHMVPESLFPSPFWGIGIAERVPTALMSVSSQNSPYHSFSSRSIVKMNKTLVNMRYISVRDNWTKDMVNYITGKNVDVTPDPVFAFNYNAPELILSKDEVKFKYNLPDKYVLVCLGGQTLSVKQLDELKNLYAKEGITCVAFKLPNGICFEHHFDYSIDGLLPSNDWYSIIKHSAGYIGTNMHPIVVSLHNAVPCFSIDNWGRTDFFNRKLHDGSSKVEDIMKCFGVSENHRMEQQGRCDVTANEIFDKMNSFPVDDVKIKSENIYRKYSEMMKSVIESLSQNN